MKAFDSTIRMPVWLCLLAGLALLVPLARTQSAAEKTYKAKCVSCHAADGTGSDAGKKLGTHDFRAPEIQKMSDAELIKILSKGKNKMPGYAKSLKAEEIKDLVAHVRELAKKS